jgi:hypothetical protein
MATLRISAEVTHELARRANAFSVGARVLEYEIRDADSANFHGLITQAEITEISLTDVPANPQAIVRNRSRVAPFAAYVGKLHAHADLTIRAVGLMQRQLEILQRLSSTPLVRGSNTASDPAPSRRTPQAKPRPQLEPHRASSFGALVSAMERNHHAG